MAVEQLIEVLGPYEPALIVAETCCTGVRSESTGSTDLAHSALQREAGDKPF